MVLRAVYKPNCIFRSANCVRDDGANISWAEDFLFTPPERFEKHVKGASCVRKENSVRESELARVRIFERRNRLRLTMRERCDELGNAKCRPYTNNHAATFGIPGRLMNARTMFEARESPM